MEFKNETKENIKYRVGDYNSGFDWYTIRPGEIKDIPIKSARNLPLIEVEADEKVEKRVEKKIDSNDVKKRPQKAKKTTTSKKSRKGLFSFKGNSKSTKKA
jgi:hypothetical protein